MQRGSNITESHRERLRQIGLAKTRVFELVKELLRDWKHMSKRNEILTELQKITKELETQRGREHV